MSMKRSQLPHELLTHVVDFIDPEDKSTLLNMLVSCRTFFDIAEPQFYRDAVFVHTPRGPSCLEDRMKGFYEQISKENARLAACVRKFMFISDPARATPFDGNIIIQILPLLINLDYFRFSHFHGRVPSMSILKSLRSPKLQTLISDSMIVEETPYFEDFLGSHPSIQHLEITRMPHMIYLPPTFLPCLRKLAATFPLAMALLPERHITHLKLDSFIAQSLISFGGLTPALTQAFSKITHLCGRNTTELLQLIPYMPDLRCLTYYPVRFPLFTLYNNAELARFQQFGSPSNDLPQFFCAADAHSRPKKLEYFSIDAFINLDFEANDVALDLFRSVPSLRVFDYAGDLSINFTRYRCDGESVVMRRPMFEGGWPSEQELSHILQTRVQADY
ncbi:hypothetical protein ONZ45_g842 [Pleurotus djamor]|nr:hypothetical protein ONZ45_g842 [Pleurotus djamor]